MTGMVSKLEKQYRNGFITRNELRVQRWRLSRRVWALNGCPERVSLVKH
jgi:hypothetical protein